MARKQAATYVNPPDPPVIIRIGDSIIDDTAQAEVNTILRLCRQAVAGYLLKTAPGLKLIPAEQPVFITASFAISYDVAVA